MDQKMARGIETEKVDRPGTSWQCESDPDEEETTGSSEDEANGKGSSNEAAKEKGSSDDKGSSDEEAKDKGSSNDEAKDKGSVEEAQDKGSSDAAASKKKGPFCEDLKTGARGTDALYYPRSATCDTPRILYVHGGSWFSGSPFTESYPQLLSRIAHLTGYVIMAVDYPLTPVADAPRIIAHSITALNWLASHGPRGCTNDPKIGPPLFIGGDSSGGGTALSTVIQLQIAPDMLVGGLRKLAAAFFYSPWTNLVCNTPDYYTNAYAKIPKPDPDADESGEDAEADDSGKDSKSDPKRSLGEAYVGDLMDNEHPSENSAGFRDNAVEYVGNDPSLLNNPILSPFYATEEMLNGAPPMYFAVGKSESIEGDSTMFAQKAAMSHVPVYLDIYDGMWHVFPMYSEGCGNKKGKKLWQALSALKRTAQFLRHIGTFGTAPCPPTPGRAATVIHYSQPGDKVGRNHEWFPMSLCAAPTFDPKETKHWANEEKKERTTLAKQIAGIKDAFALFDKNNDGKITVEELKEGMHSVGQKATREEVEKMIKEADEDSTGTIDFPEFLSLMAKGSDVEKELIQAVRIFKEVKVMDSVGGAAPQSGLNDNGGSAELSEGRETLT
eukprot:TRINITY_DN1259_c0_g3_i1.p1 TRINITY_DN1259_c0_g3~~TRINITY_DN1259_c0_g3_i1.p1  ORF type:complete len:692 (-),score=132.19 TRINITY_DN1259_c0_g3_i1:294-2126(-)